MLKQPTAWSTRERLCETGLFGDGAFSANRISVRRFWAMNQISTKTRPSSHILVSKILREERNSSCKQWYRSNPTTKLIADSTFSTRHSIVITIHGPLEVRVWWAVKGNVCCIMHYDSLAILFIKVSIPRIGPKFGILFIACVHWPLFSSFNL